MQQFIIDGVVDQLVEDLEEVGKSLEPEFTIEDIYGDEETVNGHQLRTIHIGCSGVNADESYEDYRLVFQPNNNSLLISFQREMGSRHSNQYTTFDVFRWNVSTEISAIADWVHKYFGKAAEKMEEELRKAYEAKEFVPIRWLQGHGLLSPGTLCVIDKPDSDPILIGHATPLVPPNYTAPYSYDDPNKWSYDSKAIVLAHLLPDGVEEGNDGESD